MNIPELIFSFLCLGVAIAFSIAIIDIVKDLATGQVKRLGMRIEVVVVLLLLICIIAFLVYIGYHGLIGKLEIDLLK